MRGLIDNAVRQLGRIDILVNNAGIQHTAPIEDFPVEWDAIIALNLSAVFHGTAAALPYMKKQGFGRIINIASAHGLVASAFKSAYVAAKHGVVGFTRSPRWKPPARASRPTPSARAGCAPAGREADHRAGRKNGVDQEAAARELLSESSPRCNLSRRNSWAAPPSSWRPTPPRRSPAPPFPSTAAGPRADIR